MQGRAPRLPGLPAVRPATETPENGQIGIALSEYNCLPVQFVFNRWLVNLFAKLKARFAGKAEPENMRRGRLGERAAKKLLEKQGMKFLAANFRSKRGEIDLIFRADDLLSSADMRGGLMPRPLKFIRSTTGCLVFVEVKTRSSEDWTRPAARVNAEKGGASPGARSIICGCSRILP